MEPGTPGGAPGPTPSAQRQIGCAAIGSLSYVASAGLGLWFARGIISAVLLISLGVISLSAGIAALLGPHLRARAQRGRPNRWVTLAGALLLVAGLALSLVGGVELVSWATES